MVSNRLIIRWDIPLAIRYFWTLLRVFENISQMPITSVSVGNEFCIICENASGKYFYQQISLLQADPIVLRHDGISFGYHWMQKEVDFSILKSLAEDSMMEEKQKYYMETPYFAKRHRPTILQQTLRDLKRRTIPHLSSTQSRSLLKKTYRS